MKNRYICRDCTEYATCTRRFDKQQIATCPILTEDDEPLSYRNHEGYPDPTAYFAMQKVLREEQEKSRRKARHPRTQVVRYN